MFKSLTTRIIVTTITLLVSGIFMYAAFNVRYQQTQLIDTARESAELLLHTVESSIYNTMHLGNVQDVSTILSMVGQHNQLVGVRIFHPHGVILRSSNASEVGRVVNSDDYKLYQNPKNYGIFTVPPHGEVLSLVKPIYNEPACHTCHGSKATRDRHPQHQLFAQPHQGADAEGVTDLHRLVDRDHRLSGHHHPADPALLRQEAAGQDHGQYVAGGKR